MDDDLATRTLFRDLAATEPPPSTIDVDAAIGAARRRRRLRTGALATGVAVVALGVITAVALPVLRPEPAVITTPAAPARLDPARTRLALGWIPAGMAVAMHEVTANRETITLVSGDWKGSELIRVVLLPADGSAPRRESEPLPSGSPGASPSARVWPAPVAGPEIRGIPSRWYGSMAQPSRRGQLAWHWAPGAWAYVDVTLASRSRDVAVKIARGLDTDRNAGVRMPFTMPEPPGVQLESTMVSYRSGSVGAELKFVRPGSPPRGLPYLSVMVWHDDDQAGRRGHATTTIDGRPARISSPGADAVGLILYVSKTVTILVVNGATKPRQTVLGRQATIALATAVRVVEDPAQEKNWTTGFLR